MFQYELPISVSTLDKQELLPAGTMITEQVVAEVAALGRMQSHQACVLLDYGTVATDLQRFLLIPPYCDIFADQELVCEIFARMQSVRLPLPLLQALDYFRQHDFHTYRHILMVFTLSSLLINSPLEEGQRTEADFMAGPSHDFGKICVPLHILKKAGPLTAEELDILKCHPMSGYVLAAYYLGDHLHPAALVARDHHERRDGSGYPRGTTTLDPVVEMMAACDVYDALLSPRPYRPLSFDNRTALEELTRLAEKGTLSWTCVEALIACNRRSGADPNRIIVSKNVRGTPPSGNCYGILADESKNSVTVREPDPFSIPRS